MARIVGIASLKGGVGKTTTAVNLGSALAFLEKRTLLVDCDLQGSATIAVGLDKKKIKKTLYDGFLGDVTASDLIRPTEQRDLKIIPSNDELLKIEMDMFAFPMKEGLLRSFLRPLAGEFDYILLDTPPSMGLLSLNSLTAADSLLVPIQCDYLAYESFLALLKAVRIIKKKYNPSLRLTGILLTMYHSGETISHRIAGNVRKNLKTVVFDTVIPRSVQLRESPIKGKPVLIDDITSVSAQSYLDLAKEMIQKGM